MLNKFYKVPQVSSEEIAPRSIAEALRIVQGKNPRRSLSISGPLQNYRPSTSHAQPIERVEDFVSEEVLASSNNCVPLYEGNMWRYMPGFVKHFHPRYCLLTKSTFFYFENKLKAMNGNPKPLAVIQVSDIESAQWVNVAIPEERQIMSQQRKTRTFDAATSGLPRYQFEIFLRKNNESAEEAVAQKEQRRGASSSLDASKVLTKEDKHLTSLTFQSDQQVLPLHCQ
eukprot:TRINITY_DN6325_c0_g1_i9.p1 TRINITY_DN6325_c0_g1~~TRINITY_DN6325_c0_g1_i9.p1  ORF type:complete len:227 (+),score=30.95 TRINITY_DN6325_c0_g1_i9:577-1257(+)